MGNHHHHLILEYFYHSQKILIGIIGLSVDFKIISNLINDL